jgi:hypothetical protein
MEHAVSTVRRREFVTKIASALLYGQNSFTSVTLADVKSKNLLPQASYTHTNKAI